MTRTAATSQTVPLLEVRHLPQTLLHYFCDDYAAFSLLFFKNVIICAEDKTLQASQLRVCAGQAFGGHHDVIDAKKTQIRTSLFFCGGRWR
jgi:hypothetical protein